MKKYIFSSVIVGIVIGALGTFLFMRNTPFTENEKMNRFVGMDRDSSLTEGTIDKHFIEQMIPHHEGAIEMAELAQERSKNDDVLSLADAIIESQSGEIAQMKNWYKDWFGADVPTDDGVHMGMGRGVMHGGMMGGSDLDVLKDAADFDKVFLQEMIPHHQMAVMMAEMLSSATERPEMKKLADDIIAAQEDEIEKMQSWLSE